MVDTLALPVLQREFLGNTLRAYVTAGGTFALIVASLCAVRRSIVAAFNHHRGGGLETLACDLLCRVRLHEIVLIALFLATKGLTIDAGLEKLLRLAAVLAVSFRGVVMLQALAAYGIIQYGEAGELDPTSVSAVRNIRWLVNAALWIAGALFVLENLGVNVTSVMTGLGIGGIAVALAAQAILGDLFSSFAIFMDKPFRVGDTIAVDGLTGAVEAIGVKTTRVRSIDGEMLILANSDLTRSRIRNFGLLQRRRVVISLSVDTATAVEKLRQVPEIVTAVVGTVPDVKLHRVNLKDLADSGFVFELVYYVEGPDYALYMDLREKVNLGLLEALKKAGISLATSGPAVVVTQASAASSPR